MAWGDNLQGQLGNGNNNTGNNVPVQVSTLSGVIAIAGGGGGHSLALKNDGTVWALGDNYYGQLGNGNNTDSNISVQVTGLCQMSTTVNEISYPVSVSVFPNPSSGAFKIQVHNKQSAVGSDNTIEIYNVLGEKIYSAIVNNQSSSPSMDGLHQGEIINLNVPGGIYFLHLKSEEKTTLQKLLIQK